MVPQVVPQKLGLPGGNSGEGRGSPRIWTHEGGDHHALHVDAKPGDPPINSVPLFEYSPQLPMGVGDTALAVGFDGYV